MSDSVFQIDQLGRKSILFEIINRKMWDKPIEAFILNIPPEQFEVEEPQRITKTKTFGGLFVDDYGPDNPKITISGNTGSAILRRTYAANSSEPFDGKSAFFYLRDHLMRYKDTKEDFADYDIYMYDLSTTPDNNILQTGIVPQSTDGYVVVLDKFKMSRNKEKPLFYNYQIELTALRKLGTYENRQIIIVKGQDVLTLVDILRKAVNTMKNILQTIRSFEDDILDYVNLISDTLTQVENFISGAVDVLTYPIEGLSIALGKISDLLNNLVDQGYLSNDIIKGRMEDFLNVVEMLHETAYGNARLVMYGKTAEASGTQKINVSPLEDRISSMSSRYIGMTSDQSKVYANGLSYAGLDPQTYIIYGYKTVIADQTTTLENLSVKYFGGTDFMDLIAIQNNIKGDDDIVIGQKISIPIIIKRNMQTRNLVYDAEMIDAYGKDIAVDKNGNLIISANGDFGIQEDYDNLIQAMNLRLNESLGARLRLVAYGIRASVGSSARNVLSYVLASLKDTIVQDPRIQSLENLKVRGEGDVLYISFDVKPIVVGDVVKYKGSI